MNWFFRVFLEVFSETHNEIVHGPRGRSPCVPPADFQEFFPGEGLAGILNEQFQQFGFLFG